MSIDICAKIFPMFESCRHLVEVNWKTTARQFTAFDTETALLIDQEVSGKTFSNVWPWYLESNIFRMSLEKLLAPFSILLIIKTVGYWLLWLSFPCYHAEQGKEARLVIKSNVKQKKYWPKQFCSILFRFDFMWWGPRF